MGRMMALATRYEVRTQVASSVVAERLPAIWGRLTLTTEVSSTSITALESTAIVTRVRRDIILYQILTRRKRQVGDVPHELPHEQLAAAREILEIGAELRVGYLDERFDTLAQGLAVQVGDAVLGDDVVDVAARGDHAGAGLELRNDARDRTVPGGGRQGDNRQPTLGAGGAAQKIPLPADAAVGSAAHGVRADLPGEVHFDGRVDGHHAVVLGDHERVVAIGGGVELEDGVIVDKIEQCLGPEHKSRDHFMRMQRLPLAVDDAGLDQLDDAVGKHLGVDAEVLVVPQQGQRGFGDAADAGLNGGAVGDQSRYVAGDGAVQAGHLVVGVFHQRVRGFDERIHAAHVQKGVPQRTRHLVVDFHDQVAGALRHRNRDIDAGAEAHVAVMIGRRALQQGHIDGQGAGPEQVFDLSQENGGVIGAALLNGLAYVGGNEQDVGAEVTFVLGQSVIGDPHGGHGDHLHVAQLRAAAGERIDQFHGFGAAIVYVDALPGFDHGERFIGSRNSGTIVAGHGRLPLSV